MLLNMVFRYLQIQYFDDDYIKTLLLSIYFHSEVYYNVIIIKIITLFNLRV